MQYSEINTLRVPGATLCYELRGNGPLLLLIPGGGNGAYAFANITDALATQYTVVTYDRRGISRSVLDNPAKEQRVEVHSDDAHRLLQALGSEYEPAYVFGSSGGAIIGLDLAARHPEQIQMLIAHEPPTHLSPAADPLREMADIIEIYQRKGINAALQKLIALPGIMPDEREMDMDRAVETVEGWDQSMKDMKFLFEHEFPMYDCYKLDIAALKHALAQARIVIASGRNRENTGYWSAVAVAEQLGTSVVEFPGGHVGYATNPKAFTRRLYEVLCEPSLV